MSRARKPTPPSADATPDELEAWGLALLVAESTRSGTHGTARVQAACGVVALALVRRARAPGATDIEIEHGRHASAQLRRIADGDEAEAAS